MARTIDIEDLLGTKYLLGGRDPRSGLDCLATSRLVLERIYPDFAPGELPVHPDEVAAVLANVDAGAHRWRRVGTSSSAADRVGDVLHGIRADGRAYVAVLVDDVGRIAVTAMPVGGVQRLAVWKIHGVQAVYRRRP